MHEKFHVHEMSSKHAIKHMANFGPEACSKSELRRAPAAARRGSENWRSHFHLCAPIAEPLAKLAHRSTY